LIIQDEEIMFVLGVVSKLSPRRQWLWWRVDAEQAQISEVALECGRSANALYLEICRIRRKICSALGAWERE
jgi:malate synthase